MGQGWGIVEKSRRAQPFAGARGVPLLFLFSPPQAAKSKNAAALADGEGGVDQIC
ncbi:MAG: hypothetical protein ACJ8AG_25905 [Ktedonobacteraceae bacterium]